LQARTKDIKHISKRDIMKAIGYIRVSTEDQAREGISLDNQEAKIRAWADLNGYEMSTIYTDAGISGKRADNREGLQGALNDIGKNDALVVYSLSRLARSTRDTLDISEYLEKREADLVSLSEKIDTTSASGKMVFRMLAVLNEFERDQISERTRSALQHKRAKGEKTGGDVPFGYNLSPTGHLEPHKAEQRAIRLIHRLRAKSYSLRAICRELEKEGHKTKSGKVKWHPQSVSQILKRAA
jgi:DNA invertase Pin-like site-specific DNA recombinase